MKIPIKFRGRDVESGEHIIYGFGYADLNGKKYIFDAKTGMAYHVAPDSVAQLVGYDANGKEVYEGDTLTDILGNEYTARTRIELICEDRRSTLRGKVYAGSVDNLKLVSKPKEE